MLSQSEGHGIGIINFLKHQSYLITGSTGFIGKVFVEKILRAAPEICKIYLLIQANNGQSAMQRMETEIIESEVFNLLKQQYGGSYYDFMKSKLVPVAGNLTEPSLGILDKDLARVIESEVNVIIHMGGNTNWNERYDVSLQVNVEGLSRFLNYALKWKKLGLFLYVSTIMVAYAGREKEGVILEKPVRMPESMMQQDGGSKFGLPIDIDAELKLASEFANHVPKNELFEKMTQLGMQRAKIHGLENPYLMTKAMGEMLITKLLKGKLLAIIIRPPFVECTLKEPFPGWIEGYRMLAPLILSYGKGKLKGLVGDPMAIMDLVPADITVNVMIAAMAKHGINKDPQPHDQVKVYHVASTLANPIQCQELFNIWSNYFQSNPLKDSNGKEIRVEDMKVFKSSHDFAIFMRTMTSHETTLVTKQSYNKLLRMVSMYEHAMFNKGRFDIENTRILKEDMSMEEKNIFNIDIESINWEDYFFNIHIPGIRRHVLKEKSPQAKL